MVRSIERSVVALCSKLNLFNFGVPSAAFQILLHSDAKRANVKLPPLDETKRGIHSKELPLLRADETIRGVLIVTVADGKTLEHAGLTLELVGRIEVPVDRSASDEFLTIRREVQASGDVIEGENRFAFEFADVAKPHESYYGRSVTLRYFLRATLARGTYASSVAQEQDICVQQIVAPRPGDRSIKMEVGIEECLHIEFEYDKSTYHLKDVVVGNVLFQLVRIKLKQMELAIVRRESLGSGTKRHIESDTVAKFEIMDGAPVKGERVPVRFHLAPYALTPTYDKVHGHFSVHYFLHLVLVDEEDRRYFKQQEVTLWRKTIE
ncbi:hypothetical protein PsorP6_010458 [Peronosclerospora sorghi]|uniref:Uncharacterized protein n=1 Tax=Peronosclerospora sorghi TaxID=230839 RepID=A0ACC0VU98_9STRA|nr:hypothetical protein PsorP6_010458 [Peronosclerospora sorghi]